MTTRQQQRKLGDEWRGWDGRPTAAQARAGKRLFFLLTTALVGAGSAVALLEWYLVAPRLAGWHAAAPVALLTLIGAVVLGLLATMAVLAGGLGLGWPLPAALARWGRVGLARTGKSVSHFGRQLGIDRDRIDHAAIKVHNELERAAPEPSPPERVLVLLPRCLSKQVLREARGVAAEFGVDVSVVPGGELARERIAERRPQAIVGVACERDLVSGIRDVGGRIRVLGIPNRRPEGPCKDTTIDLGALREALELCVAQRPVASLQGERAARER